MLGVAQNECLLLARTDDELEVYKREKNAVSIDGLPALEGNLP